MSSNPINYSNYAPMGYSQGPAVPQSAYGSAGSDLQRLWQTVNSAVQQGRPGAMDYLFQVLNSLGNVESANLQRNQYETMQPYMTDAAQQGRYQFGAMAPYMADAAQQQRALTGQPLAQQQWQLQQQQQQWGMQQPVLQQKYNWMNNQWNNPYINPALLYGSNP